MLSVPSSGRGSRREGRGHRGRQHDRSGPTGSEDELPLLVSRTTNAHHPARVELPAGVRAAATPDAGPPTFYVGDNGMGIERKYHDKVFGLFGRLDPEASEGTGIGLALVKRIIEVHGGRIWVESEGLGHGSTFCFTLARAGADAS